MQNEVTIGSVSDESVFTSNPDSEIPEIIVGDSFNTKKNADIPCECRLLTEAGAAPPIVLGLQEINNQNIPQETELNVNQNPWQILESLKLLFIF